MGCLRALVLNGVIVDLVGEATKYPWGLYGVGVGCQGKCASSPCMNGGVCREGYDHFDCDCRWTPFKVKTMFFSNLWFLYLCFDLGSHLRGRDRCQHENQLHDQV